MSMLNTKEVLETINMIKDENLDIRTITMGISLFDCVSEDTDKLCDRVYDKITRSAEKLVSCGCDIEKTYGIPIINKRVSITPVSLIGGHLDKDGYIKLAKTLDRAARTLGINFIGGFSALVQKGSSDSARTLMSVIPEALAETELVCSSVNVASTKAGINMDAIIEMGSAIKRAAYLTRDRNSIGCAKLVVFANVPEDNPLWREHSTEWAKKNASLTSAFPVPESLTRRSSARATARFWSLPRSSRRPRLR